MFCFLTRLQRQLVANPLIQHEHQPHKTKSILSSSLRIPVSAVKSNSVFCVFVCVCCLSCSLKLVSVRCQAPLKMASYLVLSTAHSSLLVAPTYTIWRHRSTTWWWLEVPPQVGVLTSFCNFCCLLSLLLDALLSSVALCSRLDTLVIAG